MNKELAKQIKKTMDTANKVKECQEKFCEKQRKIAEQNATIIKKNITNLMSKNLSSNKLLHEINKINEKVLNSNEVKELGICTLEKCEKNLKESFNEVLNMYKINNTPLFKKKYEEGKRILDSELNIKVYINFLKNTGKIG